MKRKMIVNYATGKYGLVSNKELKPMIRIANSILYRFGFRVGQKIDVDYLEGSVVITRR
ncbi:MAG: hypothetical protein WCO84_01920 [bacterium]